MRTEGEATVMINTFKNHLNVDTKMICVGIVGTKKCIALCGEAEAEDGEESLHNAIHIAQLWNESNNKL